MASVQPKLVLDPSRDIPFNKLVLSQANVRKIKAGVSIEDLAEDIFRRGLVQGLSARPVHNAEGVETGMYAVPAGGRRFRALELLVKQKRMARTQLVPCIVRADGDAAEDSLAENVHRMALHPLDQFRAFQTLCEGGLSEEEIAARFFVTPAVVKQRLKLAAVSPKLLDLYAQDDMTLEQLAAFAVTNDHARQEQVWESLAHTYNKEPYLIRRRLTEGAVPASDRRALFLGVDAYEAAGGVVLHDLFAQDNGGWLQDGALLDRLALERLATEAEAVHAEGWKWVEVGIEFPYGHKLGLRRLAGEAPVATADDETRLEALRAEYDALSSEYETVEDLPEEVDQRLSEIESALEAFDNQPAIYDPGEIARAGAFVSIAGDGRVTIDRGYVRPEDEPRVEREPGAETEAGHTENETDSSVQRAVITIGGAPAGDPDAPEDDDGIKPLPERLVTELTAHRTLALRDALAGDPDTAFVAVLHALCLRTFCRFAADSCLEIEAKSASFAQQAAGLNDSASAKAIDMRHQNWAKQLPGEPGELWNVLVGFDRDSQAALFAHCVALTVNAVQDQYNRNPRRLAHADRIAQAVGLDMVAAGWTPTAGNYLGRVTKARILEAVREAKGDASAQLIDHLRKPDMAKEAERLLVGTGWLPEPLRTPGTEIAHDVVLGETQELPEFLAAEDVDPQAMAAE
jgi:ParB family chromosome partitioning protein